MSSPNPWVAVVDDDEAVRHALLRLLSLSGIKAKGFCCGTEFLSFASRSKPDCAILDVHLPEMNGFEVQAQLAQESPRTGVIFITGHHSSDTYKRAMLTDPIAYLQKPTRARSLLEAIAFAFQRNAGNLHTAKDQCDDK